MQSLNSKRLSSTSVLITGGCGFIGVNLIKHLLNEKVSFIRVIDNLSGGSRQDLSRVCDFEEISSSLLKDKTNKQDQENRLCGNSKTPRVELIIGDILDSDLALNVTKDIDIIVHLAANTGVGPSIEDPRSDCYANVIGTLNYLEAARINGVKRFVFASSGAPVGECEPPIHEDKPPHPASPYGASKLAGEGYCSAYFHSFGLETVALRFGNVYGTYSTHKTSVVAKFIKRALENKALEIYGKGDQTRDFIYIDDLVNAIKLAITTKEAAGEIFQIATNSETTVNDLAMQLVKTLSSFGIRGVEVKNIAAPFSEVKRNFSDITKAKNILSWHPESDLSQGLRKTIEWFIHQGH